MKVIQILGSGCAKCAELAANAEKAVAELGLDARVEKVTDLEAIMTSGVMLTPALLVDGRVMASGKVPTVDEIKALLA